MLQAITWTNDDRVNQWIYLSCISNFKHKLISNLNHATCGSQVTVCFPTYVSRYCDWDAKLVMHEEIT